MKVFEAFIGGALAVSGFLVIFAHRGVIGTELSRGLAFAAIGAVLMLVGIVMAANGFRSSQNGSDFPSVRTPSEK